MSAQLCEVIITAADAERAGAEHSYDVPCVIALPIADGNPAYLKWVEDATIRGPG